MTKESTGTELDRPAAHQQLLDVLEGKLEPLPVDPAEFNARITRAMLEAETPEEALLAGATVSFEDGLLGVPIEVRGIALRPSSLKGSLPVFGIIDGYRLDEGVECTITCSAVQVLRTLCVWQVKGWLPSTFIVEQQETPTSAGFTPYTIRAV